MRASSHQQNDYRLLPRIAARGAATKRGVIRGTAAAGVALILVLTPFKDQLPGLSLLVALLVGACVGGSIVRALRSGLAMRAWVAIWIFIVYAITVSVLFGVHRPLGNVVLQAGIDVKFFVLFLGFSYLIGIGKGAANTSASLLKLVLWITVAFGIVNLAMGTEFNDLLSYSVRYRFLGLPRLIGFQRNPNDFAITLGLLFGAVMLKLDRPRIIHWSMLVIVSLLILISGSRVGLVLIALAMVCRIVLQGHTNISSAYLKIGAVSIVATVLLGISIKSLLFTSTVANLLDFFNGGSSYIRALMTINGLRGMVHNFPVGWGLATFGTVMSDGSPVYAMIGLASNYHLNGPVMYGIYDSSIGTIAGELGFAGIIFYAYMSWQIVARNVIRSSCRYFLIGSIAIVAVANPIFFDNYLSLLFLLPILYLRDTKCHANELSESDSKVNKTFAGG